MRFLYPLPVWALLALALGVVALSLLAYAGTRHGLGRTRQAVLVALRTATLVALVVFLLRPVAPVASDDTDAVVAVIIDSSRSMALRDGGSTSRLARAVELAATRLIPTLSSSFRVEIFAGEQPVELGDLPAMAAAGTRTDLHRTIRSIANRFPQGGLAAIVLISDGADTSPPDAAEAPTLERIPILTIGVGHRDAFDREVRSVTTGPSVLDGSLVDLTVTAVAHGRRSRSLRLRLVQNGRVLDLVDMTAAADGAPVQHVFTVAPSRSGPSLFRVEVAGDERELTLGNNRVDVLVAPPGRRRRILMLEGAPGFEHTFLKRAWLQDSSLELDSVIRKGQNDRGEDTFYVQAAGARSAPLARGFPETLEALLVYDSVVLANLDLETLSRAQLEWLAEFVGERGGGLLAFGATTLRSAGLAGSTLERVMPVDVSDRRGDPQPASAIEAERLKVTLTPEGDRHPVMRLSARGESTAERWAALPPLAGVEALGAPRPGGTVLAWTASRSGRPLPLVAIQRFGRGRAMVFAGEASWRWKMLQPSNDRSFDSFWRQAIRWLSIQSPDPVAITAATAVPVGEAVPVTLHVRDAAFRPARAPSIEATIADPDGTITPAAIVPVDVPDGRYATVMPALQPGVYRVSVSAHRGKTALGRAEHLVLAGGVDPELADPRLNEPVLRRIAEASGGTYARAEDAASAGALLRDAAAARRRELRDLWHGAWSFVLVACLLSLEWTLRRRWGLR